MWLFLSFFQNAIVLIPKRIPALNLFFQWYVAEHCDDPLNFTEKNSNQNNRKQQDVSFSNHSLACVSRRCSRSWRTTCWSPCATWRKSKWTEPSHAALCSSTRRPTSERAHREGGGCLSVHCNQAQAVSDHQGSRGLAKPLCLEEG